MARIADEESQNDGGILRVCVCWGSKDGQRIMKRQKYSPSLERRAGRTENGGERESECITENRWREE